MQRNIKLQGINMARFTVRTWAFALSVILAMFAVSSAQTTCANGTSLRKNLRTLPAAELARYTNAVIALRAKAGTGGLSVFENFAAIHDQQSGQAHLGAYFAPWHRQFLYEFEVELNKVASPGPKLSIPYWDSYAYNTDFTVDPTWQLMGGASGRAIPNAPFRNWNSRHLSSHSVQRQFTVRQGTTRAFVTPSFITNLISQTSRPFAEFGNTLEDIHGDPHNGICGDMCTFATSANEPIFYSHHAYVDMIWQRWQSAGGGNKFGGVDSSGAPALLTTAMNPYGRTVSDILTGISTCVTYETSGGSVRQTMDVTERQSAPVQEASVAPGPIKFPNVAAKRAARMKAAKVKVDDPARARAETMMSEKIKKSNVDSLRHFGFSQTRIQNFIASFIAIELQTGVDSSASTVASYAAGASLTAITAEGKKEMAGNSTAKSQADLSDIDSSAR
jgi:Common central domain of tyrosinase